MPTPSTAASAYADAIRDHVEFLADDSTDYTATRTYPTPTATFTLTVDSQNHPMREAEGGGYVSMGDSLYGYVDADELTPAISDQVTVLGRSWRIVRVQPIRVLGSSVSVWDIELTALENARR